MSPTIVEAPHPGANPLAPFLPLSLETRSGVDTKCAAFHLNRSPQTLRKWAMGTQNAPILPERVNGRLRWSTARLRELCGD